MDSGPTIPQRMKAIRYVSVGKFELTEIPVPVPQTGEVLIKGECLSFRERSEPASENNIDRPACYIVRSCGICGTDLHIHGKQCRHFFRAVPIFSFVLLFHILNNFIDP